MTEEPVGATSEVAFTQIYCNETEAVIIKIIPVTGLILLVTLMPTSDLRLPQLTVIDR